MVVVVVVADCGGVVEVIVVSPSRNKEQEHTSQTPTTAI